MYLDVHHPPSTMSEMSTLDAYAVLRNRFGYRAAPEPAAAAPAAAVPVDPAGPIAAALPAATVPAPAAAAPAAAAPAAAAPAAAAPAAAVAAALPVAPPVAVSLPDATGLGYYARAAHARAAQAAAAAAAAVPNVSAPPPCCASVAAAAAAAPPCRAAAKRDLAIIKPLQINLPARIEAPLTDTQKLVLGSFLGVSYTKVTDNGQECWLNPNACKSGVVPAPQSWFTCEAPRIAPPILMLKGPEAEALYEAFGIHCVEMEHGGLRYCVAIRHLAAAAAWFEDTARPAAPPQCNPPAEVFLDRVLREEPSPIIALLARIFAGGYQWVTFKGHSAWILSSGEMALHLTAIEDAMAQPQ
jgi:hypothetical protein